MTPAADVCFAVSSVPVTNGQVEYFQVQLGSAKKQIEIAKRIKISKLGTILYQSVVILFPHCLGPAQRVLDWLVQ